MCGISVYLNYLFTNNITPPFLPLSLSFLSLFSTSLFIFTVEAGDLLGVTYSGWLEEDNKVGKIFDSNAEKGTVFKMTVGAGKVIKV